MELLWPIPYTSAAILAHAFMARLAPGGNRVLQFLLAGIITGALLIAHLFAQVLSVSQCAAVLAMYAFACELYLFLFTMAGTSISVRLLLELRKRTLTEIELAHVNSPGRMVETRLARLIASGYVQQHDGRYRLSHAGERLVRVYSILQRFFFESCSPANCETTHLLRNEGETPAQEQTLDSLRQAW